jgi:uncharacterized protein
MSDIRHSLAAGYACLAASADLLDRINVFPVADGDTGTNLRISLAPFRDTEKGGELMKERLARCATGNSGNIAAAFFSEFCRTKDSAQLAEKAALGRAKAWQAIGDPLPGTMLTIFDSLASSLGRQQLDSNCYAVLIADLQEAVRDTTQLLENLRNANVVDSGALGMYVFFEGFFRNLIGIKDQPDSVFDLFAGSLSIAPSFQAPVSHDYCVDTVVEISEEQKSGRENLADLGESVVVVRGDTSVKIHVHTPDPAGLRSRLADLGTIVKWSDEVIVQQGFPAGSRTPPLHIVTDAAGSLTRVMARHHGITLLDSYIIVGDDSRPESLYSSEEIYALMRRGKKITTAQASTFERRQHYLNICRQFGPSLYLAVGSAFTGNYDTALAWKNENDSGNLFTVLDTGAASGRLALIALLTARFGETASSAQEIIGFANEIIENCEEYVFIHELKYLVAGGRVSRAGGFFGDLLSMKPVISPTRSGVKKAGVVRSTAGQLAFAMDKLQEKYNNSAAPVIMLQYSDNRDWVVAHVQPQITSLLPEAEVLLTPLSLTSGVHMGPGTWSMACASV